jgi:outer membrane protein OmpA-like peptidoglycan-associated protein
MTAPGRVVKAPPWLGIAVGVAGLLVIGLVQSIGNRHSIEDNLTRRSSQALEQAGITGMQVRFTGRDGSVVVTSAADVAKAREVVGGLEGVRVVEVNGPKAPKRRPSITITVNGSEVRATGTVSSAQARARLVTGSTQDALTIDPAVSDEGVADLPAVVDALGGKAKDASVVLNDGRITLSGTVESASVRDAAVAAAGRVVGPGNVTDQLSVPPPPKEVQQALISLPPITFENGSAILTPAGRTAVAKAADILRANPNVVVRIEGHTDSTGSAQSNLDLSRARATTVLDSLVALGIARERLSASGYGESRPKVPDTTPQNRAINRRVEFIVQNS